MHAKPLQEWLAVAMLEERLKLNTYLPEVKQKFRGQVRFRPFFPGYLFVQADLDQVESTAINSTPGVLRIVAFDNRPLPLGTGVIEAIRSGVDRLNEGGGLPSTGYQPRRECSPHGRPIQRIARCVRRAFAAKRAGGGVAELPGPGKRGKTRSERDRTSQHLAPKAQNQRSGQKNPLSG